MTAFVGGNGSGRKTNRRWGRSGQAGGGLGWRVAPRGALWRQARVGPSGSSDWAWQGTRAEKVSLAGCHPPGVLLCPRPVLPRLGSDGTIGWVAQARTPGATVPSSPLPRLRPSPWLCSPLHPLFMPSSSNYGAPRMSRVHSRHWGWSSKQTHPAPRSFTRPPSKVPSTFRIRQTPKRAPNAVNCESELPSRDACPALTVDLLELIPSSKPLSTPATLPVAPVH